MEFNHNPIMLNECIDNLSINENGIYVDCTIGGGGHASKICEKLTGGKLIAFDKDIEAINHCSIKYKHLIDKEKLILINSDYNNSIFKLNEMGITQINGVIMDLGVSSYQLDNAQRGFSYMADSKLDMRMDTSQQLSAYEVVNSYSLEDLNRILRDYAEEKYSYNISRNIIKAREIKPIETTQQLVHIIDTSIPRKDSTRGHNAKKTFQAIRIEVNSELDTLGKTVTQLVNLLVSGGRIVVLTFHSLEDRIVKHTIKDLTTGCICDKSQPICVCNNKPKLKTLYNKPLTASITEINNNTRSKSAKLRAAQKL